MENIRIIKLYTDLNCIELRIYIQSEFVTAIQNCYVEDMVLKDASNRILNFINGKLPTCRLVFGHLGGNYTPSLGMELSQDKKGHVLFDVTMELNDDAKPKHRCCFYLNSEIGLLEKFAKALNYLVDAPENTEISLIEELSNITPEVKIWN